MDTGNYRNRILTPLGERLGLPKLNFQVLRRTMATLAQKKGSVKDIQAHLRHAKADTTANEYMQELPESVKQDGRFCVRRAESGSQTRRGLALFATKCYQAEERRTCK
jgi:integrase